MNDEDPAPGWAMKEGALRSEPVRWRRRWMMWACLALTLTGIIFNVVRLFG